ncbi:MAG: protein arginine kinase [Bacillota bacterium]|nr:protein arginine kinase [Bacillota bacterium]
MSDFLNNSYRSKWMESEGPNCEIVISSRVRLARNIEGISFPHQLSTEEAKDMVEKVGKAIENKSTLLVGQLRSFSLNKESLVDQQILMEKHLVSPNFLKQDIPKAFIVNDDDSVSIMVNEEDHLRIQCLLPGLQLEKALEMANQLDDCLEQTLNYAFNEELGYLTTCPTNVGTGLRASVMLHLPGLVLTGQHNRALATLSQIGLTVRGIYGEGTDAKGNLFQISNQITLGTDEKEIINNLEVVTKKIIEQEEQARKLLVKEGNESIADKVFRALGLLTHARVISSNEAISLLSDVRLGIDIGYITDVDRKTLTELMVLISPGYLQKVADQELTVGDRDIRRAVVIREKLGNTTKE